MAPRRGLHRDFRRLRETPLFVAAAHAAGMSVYAEFGCFVGRQWWQQMPESRPITAAGAPLEPEGWYCGVNPAIPGVRQERLAALETCSSSMSWMASGSTSSVGPATGKCPNRLCRRTSFDPALAAFVDTGINSLRPTPPRRRSLLLSTHEAEWTAWRCAQITSWVADARAVLRRVRPQALLGLFGVPWRLSDRGGAILSIIGQEYSRAGRACRRLLADGVSPDVRLPGRVDRRRDGRSARPERQAGLADHPVGGRTVDLERRRVWAGAGYRSAPSGRRWRCWSSPSKGRWTRQSSPCTREKLARLTIHMSRRGRWLPATCFFLEPSQFQLDMRRTWCIMHIVYISSMQSRLPDPFRGACHGQSRLHSRRNPHHAG